jgi:hypothetical protein
MRINMKVLIGSMSIVAVMGIGSCTSDLTCGTGTIEMNGECIASGNPIHGNCGAGSKFNPATQQCEIDVCNGVAGCGICGPNTVPETDANGVTTCVGQGGALPCDQELACPPPDSGRQMICGRLVDTETSANVVGDTLPTTVKISFYEALAFANNAATPPEFSVAPDTCGRYVSSITGHNGVAVPGTMYILVGTDDAVTPFPGGNFITTGVALSGVGGGQAKKVNTYLTRAQTDVDWSTSAGLTGASFVEQGVFLGIFIDTSKTPVLPWKGKPTSGVQVTVADQPVMAPSQDFYFDDATNLVRSSIGSGNTTGINGAVLVTQASLDTFGGTGPTGCNWVGSLATTVPNTVFVQEREGTCP